MPRNSKPPQNLEEMLDALEHAGESSEKIDVSDILDLVGRRSFGPLLLVAGLIALTPINAIPGISTFFGLVILLFSGQLLIGRKSFWLPHFLARQSLDAAKIARGARKMQPAAAFVDRLLHPRLTILTGGEARRGIALACVMLALATPLLEFVPMATTAPAVAVCAFGLALIFHDGLLALAGYLATAVTAYLMYEGVAAASAVIS